MECARPGGLVQSSSLLGPSQDKHQEVIASEEGSVDNNPQTRHMIQIPNPNLA